MVATVLVLGVVNLVLGFALAVFLERPRWTLWENLRTSAQRPPNPAVPKAAAKSPAVKPADLVADLHAQLEQAGVQASSLVEAILWTVRLELPRYRGTLSATECQYRQGERATIKSALAASQVWYKKLSALVDAMNAVQDESPLRAATEEMLLDNVFQIQGAVAKIEELAAREQETDDEICGQVCGLIASSDNLRDHVDEAIAVLFRMESRHREITPELQHQEGSQVFTRIGMENLFYHWRANDADRIRLVSCILLDLDRFEQVNERWGTDVGDRILSKFGDLLQDLLRKGRGFDRVTAFSGQSFLLFLGDTAVRNASGGAERIRQSVEAMSFRVGDENIELTASCGVVELGKTEQIDELAGRLKACVAAAKGAGRNRSFADHGSGPQAVDLPQFQVQGRVVDV